MSGLLGRRVGVAKPGSHKRRRIEAPPGAEGARAGFLQMAKEDEVSERRF